MQALCIKNTIEVGDKTYSLNISRGKSYQVIKDNSSGQRIYVINDVGEKRSYSKKYFKIESILSWRSFATSLYGAGLIRPKLQVDSNLGRSTYGLMQVTSCSSLVALLSQKLEKLKDDFIEESCEIIEKHKNYE